MSSHRLSRFEERTVVQQEPAHSSTRRLPSGTASDRAGRPVDLEPMAGRGLSRGA